MVRERMDIIEMGSTYVNKMQKSLELMNIKLTEVISQIHGASGIKMIKAIIEGNRDQDYLLSLCDKRISNHKADLVLKALEGNYNDTYLFMLEQNLKMWEIHQQQITIIDNRISQLLQQMSQHKAVPPTGERKSKAVRHHRPKIEGLHQMLISLYGVDATSVSGINDYTLLRLIGETGVDMTRFATSKQFVSWCGLSPKHHQTGKTSKRVKGTRCNKTGQIFKELAQSLINSKHIAIGSFIRKLRARKDAAIAIKAGARKLAIAYYDTLTKGRDYVEQGIRKYEEQIARRQKAALHKVAKKYHAEIIDKQTAA